MKKDIHSLLPEASVGGWWFTLTHKIPFVIRLTFETNSAKLREYLAEQVKQQGYKYNRKLLIPSIPKGKRKLEHPSDKLPESVPAWISNIGFRSQSSCFFACSYHQRIDLFSFWKIFVSCEFVMFASVLNREALSHPPSNAVDQLKIMKP